MTPPDQAARDAALRLDRSVLAIAPAGSGKTGLLLLRFLSALAVVDAPEQVVAITFTNKAAAEIRERVIQALALAAQADCPDPFGARIQAIARAVAARDEALGWGLMRNPTRLRIQTIDAFNAAIAAELPLFSGLGGRLSPSEDGRELIEAAVLGLLDETLKADEDDPVRQALETWLGALGNRLDGFFPALVSLLERRDQWLTAILNPVDANADLLLLERLARQAHQRLYAAIGGEADELVRIARLAGAANPEAFGWATGLTTWPAPGRDHAVHQGLARLLLTEKDALRKPGGVRAQMGIASGTPAFKPFKALLERLQGDDALASAAAELKATPEPVLPEGLLELREALRVLLKQALAHLRVEMSLRGETDFTGIALAALEALRPEGGYGEALLRRDAQIRHLMVDEMQDTSAAQVRLLELLTEGWLPGDGRSLFLVGDPQQSIYAFRKADVRVFQGLVDERRLGALPLDVVRLTANFRSSRVVIDWINARLSGIFPRQPDPLVGEVPYNPCQGTRSEPGEVLCQGFATSEAEAQAAVAHVRAALAEGREVAVLGRTRKQLAPVLRALRASGLAYQAVDMDPLESRPAVRDLHAALKALRHPADRLAWLVWLRAPWVGLSWADLVALSAGKKALEWPERLASPPPEGLSAEGRARIERLNRALAELAETPELEASLPAALRTLWHRLGGTACVDALEAADCETWFAALEQACEGGQLPALDAFEQRMAALFAQSDPAPVQVMTFHKAKGLEFDTVILVGLGEGRDRSEQPLMAQLDAPPGAPLLITRPPKDGEKTDPHAQLYQYLMRLSRRSRDAEALRLLYVGLTRAKRRLILLARYSPPNENGERTFPDKSPAARLGVAFPLADEPASAAVPAPTPAGPPLPPQAPRLPLDWRPSLGGGLPPPKEDRRLRPSQTGPAGTVDTDAAPDDGGVARRLGTVLHRLLAHLATDGLARWTERSPEARAAALRAALRAEGLPPQAVEHHAGALMSRIERWMSSATARWLLGPFPWAACELAVAGYVDNAWVSGSIDRCFETADGALWVVDYKSARPGRDADPSVFQRETAQRYGEQVRRYAALLARLRGRETAVAALYLTELDALIDDQGRPLQPPAS